MAWQYCRKCDRGMDEPTIEEVCNQNQKCPNCHCDNDPKKSLGELVLELAERIKALEDDL